MMQNNAHTKGFTLIEMLVYLVTMVLVLAALTYFIAQVYGYYTAMTIESRVDRAASTLSQVLASEMRSGESINQANTTFGVPDGMLTINAREGETAVVKEFSIENNRVRFEDGGETYLLTPEDMIVSKFLFTQITTTVSYAVRYEVDITFMKEGALTTKTYPGVVILRHSYE